MEVGSEDGISGDAKYTTTDRCELLVVWGADPEHACTAVDPAVDWDFSA